MTHISLIAALTKKGRVIGKDNKLLWHIPEDLKNFKKLTSGNVIIMGRKTFESLGRVLPNRHHIVITSSKKPINGVEVAHSINEAVTKAKQHKKEIYVIGGEQIYGQFLPFADKLMLSYVKKEFEGDAFFPKFNEKGWIVSERQDFPEFEYVVYDRK